MFSGIVQEIAFVTAIIAKENFISYALGFSPSLVKGLKVGASCSIDGICQTVTKIEGDTVWFDAIDETLNCTSLKNLKVGDQVNIERALKMGDELGGHLISGHICTTVEITKIEGNIYTFACPQKWCRYLFTKGFVALDGMSLTVVEVDRDTKQFCVHLIPETLKETTIEKKQIGAHVNLEVDYLVQALIDSRGAIDGKAT